MTGLYIHIPFCAGKCPYCDFYSLAFDGDAADAYVKAVLEVIASGRFAPGTVDTVYFGGGTPGLMGAARLGAILDQAGKSFGIAGGSEITLEMNPGHDIDFPGLRRAGFNRLSVGVQSGLDDELAALGRRHTAAESEAAITSAYNSGFENISADLMLAVPGQTAESLARSVGFIAALPVSHISAYLLKVEEGTGFYDMGVSPDEDESADLYLDCVRMIEAKGFPQYEISNFARKGMESKHNLKYWLGAPYLGIGPSAHSCLNGERFFFRRDLQGFMSGPFAILESDGPGGGCEEYVMLRLRLTEGLDLAEASRLFGKQADSLRPRAEGFARGGYVKLRGTKLSLTPEGFLISNTVISSLLA